MNGKIFIFRYEDAHTLIENGFEVISVVPNRKRVGQKLVFVFPKSDEICRFAVRNNIIKGGQIYDEYREEGKEVSILYDETTRV